MVSQPLVAGESHAAIAAPDVSFHAALGAEHDSNVSLKELDQVTNEADWATIFNTGAKLHWAATDKLSFNLGANYDAKQYQTFNDYDLGILRGHLEGQYDFSLLTLGASHHQASARLDHQDFLHLTQHNLFASKLFDHRIFVRGQLTQQEKIFDEQPARDADNLAWGGDMFWFMEQGNCYIQAGINADRETAYDRQYNYDGLNFRLSWSRNFVIGGLESQAQLGWRYVNRNYAEHLVTEANNEGSGNPLSQQFNPQNTSQSEPRYFKRSDQQQHWEAKWTLTLNSTLSLAAKVSLADYQSNLESADYSETLTSFTLKSQF